MNLLINFWHLFLASAPWLLLGFTIAGLIKTLIPEGWLNRHLGQTGWWSTVQAAFIGAPMPLCSCGVVPVALGLRQAGASKNATVAFLVATPETGGDSVFVTYALLGPFMAVVRPIAAITSGIVAGLLVGAADHSGDPASTQISSSCCDKKPEPEKEQSSCCSKENKPQSALLQKLLAGLTFSYVDMLRDITPWLLLGLAFAAAVETWVPASFLAQWGDGFWVFVVMALIGVPMYICATASTPIAAGLLLSGLSPGAVLVFMMAGPATNIGTLAIITRELGTRAVIAYLTGVIAVSFVFGYLTNFIVQYWDIDIVAQAGVFHGPQYTAWTTSMAVILALLMINSFIKRKVS
ncbi:MAG: SO_0444 family Cu/Zn efflux transporter [Pseudomonadales bacterium]|nr:SO_0444 family Cu/Zn efflux transporter [Pseudomonadales bacterium]